jgi:hypothetical protein
MPEFLDKILEQHHNGNLTDYDLTFLLVKLAASVPSAAIVERLPIEVVDDLRVMASQSTFQESEGYWVGSYNGPDPETYEREVRSLIREGLQRWRDYFARTKDGSVAPPGLG